MGEARNGNVILKGEVATDIQREEAERAVRELPGVWNVVNEVTIRA